MPQPHKAKQTANRPPLERSVIYGFLLAFGGLLGALWLQGGSLLDLLQIPSALLVLGGTAGAVLVTMPFTAIREALEKASKLFYQNHADAANAVMLITRLVRKARRTGIASLEPDVLEVRDPILRRALRMATDGLPANDVSDYMQLEIRLTRRRAERQARVFEAAGGYAPTLGILGAVLGLIQVMKHLDQIATVGHGIAEAFVSTIYGLALANLVLLPIAGRLRASASEWVEAQELLRDGVAALIDRMNPMVIESKLAPYMGELNEDAVAGVELKTPGEALKHPLTMAKGAGA